MSQTREAYPVWLFLSTKNTKITIPDFDLVQKIEGHRSLVDAMTEAKSLIEIQIKERGEAGQEIPAPGSKEHTKEKAEIFTYVSVDLDLFQLKMDMKEYEEDRKETIWDNKENVIEFYASDDLMGVTLTKRSFINKVKTMAEQFPDEVKIISENSDGSLYAKVPVRYLNLKRPKEGKKYTEEEKEELINRLKAGRESGDVKSEE